ncbi:TetR family transcriptional regulator [Kitasatospora sp. HPMI-4]|uniref:TetR family transcriptional regulator n=1 Tax=Kitasatospora sp. HPMI-4 TaxID=3448443 RepID=UPI003F1A8CF5
MVGTAHLTREKGAADTTLDDVRAATATSKSQLFHYFPDGRSDLLPAVAEYEAGQVLESQQPYLRDLSTGSRGRGGGRPWPTTRGAGKNAVTSRKRR